MQVFLHIVAFSLQTDVSGLQFRQKVSALSSGLPVKILFFLSFITQNKNCDWIRWVGDGV